ERWEAMLKAKGIRVFARIDHAARRRGRRHATSPDRAADLRRSNGGHGTYAARADYWHRPAPEGARLGRCERWRVDLLRCPSVASGTAGLHHGSADAVPALAFHPPVGGPAKIAQVAARARSTHRALPRAGPT